MTEGRPSLCAAPDAPDERAVVAEALRRYGPPVTDIEAIEFHILKEQIREELRTAGGRSE